MKKSRIEKETETVYTMIKMYCKSNHFSNNSICDDCMGLVIYAESRVSSCEFGNKKPVCGKCKVHCYKHDMREKIKTVMRYSGARMICKHPLMLVRHAIDFVVY